MLKESKNVLNLKKTADKDNNDSNDEHEDRDTVDAVHDRQVRTMWLIRVILAKDAENVDVTKKFLPDHNYRI